jgi:hypothetical protein
MRKHATTGPCVRETSTLGWVLALLQARTCLRMFPQAVQAPCASSAGRIQDLRHCFSNTVTTSVRAGPIRLIQRYGLPPSPFPLRTATRRLESVVLLGLKPLVLCRGFHRCCSKYEKVPNLFSNQNSVLDTKATCASHTDRAWLPYFFLLEENMGHMQPKNMQQADRGPKAWASTRRSRISLWCDDLKLAS